MTQFCAEPGCGVLVQAGRCRNHGRDRLSRYDYARIHRWFGSARWQALRRDVIRSEPFCRTCRDHGHKRLTVDVDHIRKHDGNPVLFWDRANLQGLCKGCHAIKTKRGE